MSEEEITLSRLGPMAALLEIIIEKNDEAMKSFFQVTEDTKEEKSQCNGTI